MQDLTCGGVAHGQGEGPVARPLDEDEAEAGLGADDARAVLAVDGDPLRRPAEPYMHLPAGNVRRCRLKQQELSRGESMVPLLEGARRDLGVPGAASAAEPRERPRRKAHEHLRDEVVGQRDVTRGGAGRVLLEYSLPRLCRHNGARGASRVESDEITFLGL